MSEASSQAERLADGGERYGACDEQVKLERAQGNALASGADEGRDKLRKASGRSKYPSIRGSPNGATRRRNTPSSRVEQNRRGKGTA